MAKAKWFLVGLVAAGAATFAFRDSIGPFLPAPVAAALKSTTGVEAGSSSGNEATQKPAEKRNAGAPPSKKGAGGPAPVTAAAAAIADMPVILSAPGTVEPIATVALKPRVDGQIVEVGFKEGDMVEAGAVLYRLDDRLVLAQIKQVEAQITRDQASLKDAVSIAERRETLFQKKYASEAAAETARQNVEVLKASIAASRALLEMQRTQLDYLTIRAPITGRTGSMNAKLGAFVRSADPTPLVTINQTKPINVAFALPQSTLRQLKDAMTRKAEAAIGVKGAKPVSVKGVLSFVDNQIDRTTGTVTGKVTVENMDEVLWPGLAVIVDVTVETRKGLVAVPASAVLPAQQGMIVWVIGADRRVSVRPVVQEQVISQTAYLSKGLNEGEQVVTDGQLRLVPGAVVSIRGPAGAPKSAGGGEKGGKQKSGEGNAGGG
jgi:multidrug efflux system membrane fusion protein